MSNYVKIAKRENNNKRGFLIVNPYLGKHVPINPNDVFDCFEKMAEQFPEGVDNTRTLVIGFAETATALGIHYAIKNKTLFMQTTREQVAGAKDYIYFSEEHSHATAQYIVKDDLDAILDRVDRIIFVDDEITTGKTVLNAINAIKRQYEKEIQFDVVSIINSMNDEQMARYNEMNIGVYYVEHLSNENYNKIADSFTINNENFHKIGTDIVSSVRMQIPECYLYTTRHVLNFNDANIAHQYDFFAHNVLAHNEIKGNVLVLGTEEFMYPGLKIAQMLSECDGITSVKFHATTRSPIAMSNDAEYPLHNRYELNSPYEFDRRTFVYDLAKYDSVVVVTEDEYVGAGLMSIVATLNSLGSNNITIIRAKEETYKFTMVGSYTESDVTLLLTDITGKVAPEDTETREKKIQAGTHYCEMLPVEYVPTKEYEKAYEEMVEHYAKPVADAVCILSEKIYNQTKNPVLVSLARAGIPAGIMVKHYLEKKYEIFAPHYSISIIRGKGIDKNAMDTILRHHSKDDIIFVDGWTGKGAIKNQLTEAVKEYDINPILAVIADPAGVAEIYGSAEDLMIPSACLNSTISGLISRTFLREDIIGPNDYHGAVCYHEMKGNDKSYDFIEKIENYFCYNNLGAFDSTDRIYGMSDVQSLAKEYNISNINLIKPGIGESTRVLLRRVPDVVIVNKNYQGRDDLKPILRLAHEKNVKVVYRDLNCYKVCGIIKNMADA